VSPIIDQHGPQLVRLRRAGIERESETGETLEQIAVSPPARWECP